MDVQIKDRTALLYLQNRVAYARDQGAYKELYLYFYPSMYRLALVIAGEETMAEEVVSDVMIRIWTMEYRLAYVEHLKTYLLTAVRNTALTHLKKKGPQIPIPEEAWDREAAAADIPDQRLMTAELSELIERTVRALPQKCQEVYRLIKEEGLSYKEVGTILQLSQNTLETHMCTALKKLRAALSAYLLKKKS
ncbi:sigma-70 family RNA polymerase sigma factor [Niabella sp.]|uniref:RNA polymerase sigma factor n=1 Tax=Niabella sp. TaxID=1962976 RepID=UPI00262041BA|nr:sigma-70 family RNA polymerase sigma factor [Niabella sp.]